MNTVPPPTARGNARRVIRQRHTALTDHAALRADRGALIQALTGAVFHGNTCHCIFHDDSNASAGIYEDKGAWRFKCHGCGFGGDIIDVRAKLNNRTVDDELRAMNFVAPATSRIVATYDYDYGDAAESLLYQSVRLLPKDFRVRRPDGNGGWINNLNGVTRVLYRFRKLLTAAIERPDEWRFIAEGEKDVDRLDSLGLIATCNVGGAGKWKDEYSPNLRGRKVALIPDNDSVGRDHVEQVARSLKPYAAEIRIVELPGLPPKGDVSDYLDNGGTVDSLLALVRAAPVWTEGATASAPPTTESWRDPQALPAGLPPVMPFDFALLPNVFQAWVMDISERMQCPPDYCASTAMVVAGALIGRKVAIRPKRHDDWQVVVNLFGMNVGRPSLLKTPAMLEALNSLKRLEVKTKQEYEKAMEAHAAAVLVREATNKLRKADLAKAVKDGGDAQAIADEIAKGGTDEPVRRRFLVNDTTVEKLGMILAENPNGVLIFADELISLLRTMDREGHEGDRGFYLMAWAGNSRYTYDRIGRGTLDIEAAIVSIIGSIQPGVVADYLRAAVNGGAGDDGLLPRFQMTVWPDPPATTWQNIDRYPDADARNAAYSALDRLAELTPGDVEAERDNFNPDALPFLRFDLDAQATFDRWRHDLETRLRAGDLHPAIESHLAKYRSLIPSLALILHLLDGGIGPVSFTAAEKAVRWGSYLESHARRLYAGVTEAPAVAARLLAARIQAGDVSGPFAARDVYRNGWAGLDKDRTEAAIDVLLSLNWLEERVEPTSGKPRTRYATNPKIVITQGRELTLLPKAPSVSNVSDPSEDIAFFNDNNEGGQ